MMLRLVCVFVLQPMCIAMLWIVMIAGVSSVRANHMSVDVVVVMLSGVLMCVVFVVLSIAIVRVNMALVLSMCGLCVFVWLC